MATIPESQQSDVINQLQKTFADYKTSTLQRKILSEAGIKDPADPKFLDIIKASLDFAYHAEYFFPDPQDPNKRLVLEPWQKAEIQYAQWGEGFGKDGTAIRKPIAINSPRGFGKSVFSSIVANEFAIHFPYTQIALFSTSQDQANDLMEKVRYFVKHSLWSFMIDKKKNSKSEFGLINGSTIKAFPQSEVTIRGYHPHIKIIDEKSRIKREILEAAIRPMGRKVCWLEIGISTPFGMNNNHYEDCNNPDLFHVHILRPTEVSWVDAAKLTIESQMMGDRVARQELYAEFLEDADTVFSPRLIEQMLNLRLKPKQVGEPNIIYIMGADFGKHRDYSVICLLHIDRRGEVIIDWIERHLHVDYKVIVIRMADLCDIFKVGLIVPDGTGVGISILEDLERAVKGVPIYMTKLKGRGKDGEEKHRMGFYFTNQTKLNAVDELLRVMTNNKLRCPHHFNTTDPRKERFIYKILENEMLQFSYTRSIAGNIIFSHPEDGKSHDDTLISVMLANWGLRYLKATKSKIKGVPNARVGKGDRLVKRTFGNAPR